jgi:CBS domain-containing membrane protein
MKNRKIMLALAGQGGLLLVVGAIGWAARMPLLFASLGPTAYELVEKPSSKSARMYNIVLGHYIGLAAGFFSLWVLSAWAAPKVASAGLVSSPRLWAVVLSAALTAALTILLKATQPAALSTTLLVSLGSMQTARDAVAVIIGVLIIVIVGEPVRRLSLNLGVKG